MTDAGIPPKRLDVFAGGSDPPEPTPDEIAEHLWLEDRHDRKLREYEDFMSDKLGSDWRRLGFDDEAFRVAHDAFWGKGAGAEPTDSDSPRPDGGV